ncbi:hypothetical protein [Micromonospora echinospora]|nr:hypothetical protein [Micromonospora echinospora]
MMQNFPARANGDKLTEDAQVYVDADGRRPDSQGAYLGLTLPGKIESVWLNPDAARRMGEWFATRYGVGGYLGAKAGETVKVLNRDGSLKRTEKVADAIDFDGEYLMEDGSYVSAVFVRHAAAILPEDEKPAEPVALKVGDVVELKPNAKTTNGAVSTSRRT